MKRYMWTDGGMVEDINGDWVQNQEAHEASIQKITERVRAVEMLQRELAASQEELQELRPKQYMLNDAKVQIERYERIIDKFME